MPKRLLSRLLLLLASLLALAGCETAGYYAQSIGGHLALLRAARPVPELLADPATPAELRERLQRSQRMRDFSVRELALPDNASYRRYAELDRPAVVWNVAAAPPFSLELRRWCFPVAGCVGYRGYFDRAAAEAEAARLREAEGLETVVLPVPAYSTLGKLPGDWFADPLLSTLIRWPEPELARLIFHELAHQRLYLAGDTAFNESYATAVERLGGARWLAAEAGPEARAADAAFEARREAFRGLVARYRAQLDALYRTGGPAERLAADKDRIYAELRAAHVALRDGAWGGDRRYDAWFARANNALLGLQAAYFGWVPAFEALFEREGRDFARFHAAVEALAGLPAAEREATLRALMPPEPVAPPNP
ncbi:aminopeptidase [Piscinibacter sp. Jin2]|uniref:Aminopeptidase n=1 Tax=Aquariibacter lacus TaxID=2801332 RepID=A0A9X0XCM4_9BURK|nr:aminopeptidase [Piscinibacter lacus]MBL0719124.1 aminopeptidase [Piscinibacter lacus]